MARGGHVAKRAFDAMMVMRKIDVAKSRRRRAAGACRHQLYAAELLCLGFDVSERSVSTR